MNYLIKNLEIPVWLKYWLNKKIKKLPDEYEKIPYLESTGTQYIDLDYIPSNKTDFIIKLATTDENPSTIRRILGGYNTSNRYELGLHYNETDGIFLNYYSASVYGKYIPILNKPFVVKKKGTKFIVPDNTYNLSSATFSPEKKSFLFASNRQNTSKFIGRIYYFKMTDENGQVFNMLPAKRKADNELGMYDLVTDTFFTNSGSGSFKTEGETNETELI